MTLSRNHLGSSPFAMLVAPRASPSPKTETNPIKTSEYMKIHPNNMNSVSQNSRVIIKAAYGAKLFDDASLPKYVNLNHNQYNVNSQSVHKSAKNMLYVVPDCPVRRQSSSHRIVPKNGSIYENHSHENFEKNTKKWFVVPGLAVRPDLDI